jgi:hypothetical protein
MVGTRRLGTLAAVVLVIVAAGPAYAQIGGASATTAGSSCGASNTADRFCGSSAQILTNNGTTLSTRYAWNINADIGIFSTSDMTGSAHHNVDFTATAPGGYRLNITTSRVGDINRLSDALNCDGAADVGGVAGSSNVALSSGTLALGDPGGLGNGTSTTSIGINQSTGIAQIFRVSNGVPQSHTLDFTWSGSVRSNSCEAAVRIGQQNGSTTGCDACGYPGDPSRTQATDGHLVTVTFASLCGNGTIDGSVGEQCDEGSANGSFTSCCTTTCQLKAAGTDCSVSNGICDPVEECTGSSATCPADVLAPDTQSCRAPAGACDAEEFCTGSSPGCPFDFKLGPSSECRPSGGACDPAEVCPGNSNTCPADVLDSAGTECRAQSGSCDVAEACTGLLATCPPDLLALPGTECRPAADDCDVAESCTGLSAACPADGVQPDGTTCDDGDACTSSTTCTAGTCGGGSEVVCGPCESCDTGGGCLAAPRTSCRASTEPFRSKVLVKDSTPDDVDKLIWKWIKGEATTTGDFGDPLSSDDYAFCLFDQSGLVMSAAVPAGGTCGTKPCWKALSGKGYKYVDKEGTPDGVTKLLLRSGGAGLAKVILKGKGANLDMPSLPLTLNVTAQVQGANGECWTTIHTPLGTSRNDGSQFKSKDGSPSAAFVD